MRARFQKIDMRTSQILTSLRFALLAAVVIVSIAPNAAAQRSRAKQSPTERTPPVIFTKSISNLQPVLLKRFTTDSVTFVADDELSDAMKIQQEKLAVREIGVKIYTKMTRKGFSLYSFEETPARARENMRGAIVVEGSVHQIEVRPKGLHVSVTVQVRAADEPDSTLAKFDITGTIKLVSEEITQGFIGASRRE